MPQNLDMHPPGDTAEFSDSAWADVLQAVDRTYSELVSYQEQLESRNNELRALRRVLASILTSVSDFLIVISRDGLVEEASASFCTALDRNKEALSGAEFAEFVVPGDREALRAALAQVLGRGHDMTLEVCLETAHGADPVELRIAPRLDRRGRRSGAVLTGRPLGELRRAYSELEASHRALQDTQSQLIRNEKLASLGRLLAGVAHELNNPISFVYANAHALEKYASRFEAYFERVQQGATRKELIGLRHELKLDRELKNLRTAVVGARDGAERVRDIVEDLRRLSADGSGEAADIDLAEITRVAASWVERGTKSDVTIRFEGLDALPVRGRPGHIQQVVMNLLQNATDAVAEVDAPLIRILHRTEGPLAVIEVIDNGHGVPAQIAETIFDPFFTTKDVGSGTGLGLSISHKIAKEHGGDLKLCSTAGPGACFRLELPRGGDT
ncbi:sensor histidine kinase [Tropicimonas sp. IMCC34043]|uniref:sensor histidine kinase n=1 Tax=Tropicimonas sp. IMCC34043 TaxID=2248760 RepID=UPI0018E55D2B|nr:ATP-binding protein [Tropicimonas sp. IMCC34043]